MTEQTRAVFENPELLREKLFFENKHGSQVLDEKEIEKVDFEQV